MRRLLALCCLLVCGLVALGAAPALSAPVPPGTGGYDLERPPSECIGLLQRPDCGREPVDAGERGGTLQYVTFGIILAGLAVIFTVVFVNVIRGDRAKAAQVRADDTESTDASVPATPGE